LGRKAGHPCPTLSRRAQPAALASSVSSPPHPSLRPPPPGPDLLKATSGSRRSARRDARSSNLLTPPRVRLHRLYLPDGHRPDGLGKRLRRPRRRKCWRASSRPWRRLRGSYRRFPQTRLQAGTDLTSRAVPFPVTPATISINRAPVLTLWAAVVAQRLGFRWHESLSLGRALAGLNAQSKGRRLGIFKPAEARKAEHGEEFWIEVCGRPVPAKQTPSGIRAVKGRAIVTAEGTEAYLEAKFGDRLESARLAMTSLAKAYRPAELAEEAFHLYEEFRPAIPEGRKGWGAKGVLDLRKIRAMARR
jgi:hypothetical protein